MCSWAFPWILFLFSVNVNNLFWFCLWNLSDLFWKNSYRVDSQNQHIKGHDICIAVSINPRDIPEDRMIQQSVPVLINYTTFSVFLHWRWTIIVKEFWLLSAKNFRSCWRISCSNIVINKSINRVDEPRSDFEERSWKILYVPEIHVSSISFLFPETVYHDQAQTVDFFCDRTYILQEVFRSCRCGFRVESFSYS